MAGRVQTKHTHKHVSCEISSKLLILTDNCVHARPLHLYEKVMKDTHQTALLWILIQIPTHTPTHDHSGERTVTTSQTLTFTLPHRKYTFGCLVQSPYKHQHDGWITNKTNRVFSGKTRRHHTPTVIWDQTEALQDKVTDTFLILDMWQRGVTQKFQKISTVCFLHIQTTKNDCNLFTFSIFDITLIKTTFALRHQCVQSKIQIVTHAYGAPLITLLWHMIWRRQFSNICTQHKSRDPTCWKLFPLLQQ